MFMSHDPGFFAQMTELRHQLSVANKNKTSNTSGKKEKRVRIRNCSPAERATTEWAIPSDFSIVCSGLACVDMQLNRATGGSGGTYILLYASIYMIIDLSFRHK